ncbi:MAG: ABC transporter transmembrane domain-containing protein, partial [Parvularculaceae bacterium]
MADTTSPDPSRSTGAAFVAEIERDKRHRDKAKSVKPLRMLLPFILRYKALLFLFLFFLVVAAILNLTLPAAGRLLLDCGFAGSEKLTGDLPQICQRFALGDPANVGSYFKLAILVGFLVAVSAALRFYFVGVLGQRVIADIRTAVFSHLTTLSPEFYEQVRTGEVLSRLTTDTTLIETVIGSSISFARRSIATTIGALALMFLVSWKLTLMMLAIGPAIILPAIFLGKKIQKLSREGQDRLADASARAGESLGAIQTGQAFTREKFERDSFASATEATFQAQRKGDGRADHGFDQRCIRGQARQHFAGAHLLIKFRAQSGQVGEHRGANIRNNPLAQNPDKVKP